MSSANPLQLLRSSTAHKRPDPTGLVDGRPAINTNVASPGLFFKDSAGNLVKIGPVHVGPTAPNASPASGGAAGNSVGEQWLDTAGGTYVFKVWDGSAWRSEAGTFVDVNGDVMTGALVMDNQQQVRFREVTANGTNYIALQAPASVTSDKTITLPDVNGTVVTTGDTGTVTSTMIADATIVDADISASAEIAVSKLADGTARQLLQTDAAGTGVEWTSNVDVPGTLDVTGAATFDSTVAVTGALTKSGSNVVTVGDTGTVTSTMILDGTIVNADVNASAAIAGTKISPDFGSQNITTTGTNTAASFIPTSSTAPANGVYLPAANSVAISTGGTGRLFIDSNGNVLINNSTSVTSNVSAYLRIRQVNAATDTSIAIINAQNSDADATVKIKAGQYTRNGGEIVFGRENGADWSTSTSADGYISFSPVLDNVNQERLRITSAGLVGIGTSSPSSLLALLHTASTAYSQNTEGLTLRGSSGTVNRFTSLNFDGSGYAGNIANVAGVTTTLGTSYANSAGALRFATKNTTDATPVDRLSITAAGNVGIGTTSPAFQLEVKDTVAATSTSAFAGFQATAANTSFSYINFGDSDDSNIGQIAYQHSSDSLNFVTNNATRATIDSSGRVGIGTTSPLQPLHVKNAGSTACRLVLENSGSTAAGSTQIYSQNNDLVFDANSSERARIDSSGRLLVGTSSSTNNASTNDKQAIVLTGGLTGGQSVVSYAGGNSTETCATINLKRSRSTIDGVVTTHGAISGGWKLGELIFSGTDGSDFSPGASISARTDGTAWAVGDTPGVLVFSTTADGASSPTERLRIDSSGRLLVGTSNNLASYSLQVANTSGNGIAAMSYSSTGEDGAYITLYHSKSGTVGTHSTLGVDDDLGIIQFSGSNGTAFWPGASIKAEVDAAISGSEMPGRLVFSTTADGASSPTEQLRITSDRYVRLASGTGGIQFNGDTAAANALDDYEEGTFTPVIIGSTTTGTATYSKQNGKYTKVGNRVFWEIYIIWTGGTGTGDLRVSGLPFTVSNTLATFPAASIGYAHNVTISADHQLLALQSSNNTYVYFYQIPSGGGVNVDLAYDASGTMILSGDYNVA